MSDAYEEPLTVTPIRGAVLVTHPRGSSAVVVTAEAAFASAELLTEAAKMALSPEALDPDDVV